MSLIPDRYRCPQCDGYVGQMFKGLSSRCKCDDEPPVPYLSDRYTDAQRQTMFELKCDEIRDCIKDVALEQLYAMTAEEIDEYWKEEQDEQGS